MLQCRLLLFKCLKQLMWKFFNFVNFFGVLLMKLGIVDRGIEILCDEIDLICLFVLGMDLWIVQNVVCCVLFCVMILLDEILVLFVDINKVFNVFCGDRFFGRFKLINMYYLGMVLKGCVVLGLILVRKLNF